MNGEHQSSRKKQKGNRGAVNPTPAGENSITRYGDIYTNTIKDYFKEGTYINKYQEKLQVREYFNQVAEGYDKFYSNTLSITENEHVKELIEKHLGDLKSEIIVDLGCGTGLLNRMFPDCNNITGVDISENMLREARKQHPHGTFIRKDIISTGLPDSSVEIVISLFGSLAYNDFDNVMKEVDRILIPGGCVFLMHLNRFSIRNIFHGFRKRRKYAIRYCDMDLNWLSPPAYMLSKKEIENKMEKYLTAIEVVPLYDYKIKMFPHNLIGIGIKNV